MAVLTLYPDEFETGDLLLAPRLKDFGPKTQPRLYRITDTGRSDGQVWAYSPSGELQMWGTQDWPGRSQWIIIRK